MEFCYTFDPMRTLLPVYFYITAFDKLENFTLSTCKVKELVKGESVRGLSNQGFNGTVELIDQLGKNDEIAFCIYVDEYSVMLVYKEA